VHPTDRVYASRTALCSAQIALELYRGKVRNAHPTDRVYASRTALCSAQIALELYRGKVRNAHWHLEIFIHLYDLFEVVEYRILYLHFKNR